MNDSHKDKLTALALRYPWFNAGRRAATPKGGRLPAHMALKELFRTEEPKPKVQPAPVVNIAPGNDMETPVSGNTDAGRDDPMTIIDRFLESGQHKIVLNENTPDTDYIGNEYEISPADELLSEELAEIMIKQELYTQAAVIYRKLSLLYPKKSVYFAELMVKAEEANKK